MNQPVPAFTVGGRASTGLDSELPARVEGPGPHPPVPTDFMHPSTVKLDRTRPVATGRQADSGHLIPKEANRPASKASKRNLTDASHQALISLMITKPRLTNKQLGAELGYTESWVARVKDTDAFQEQFHQRLRDHQALVSAAVIGQVQDVAMDGLEAIAAKLHPSKRDREKLPDLVSATETMLKALGMGHQAGPSVNVSLSQSFSAARVSAPAASVASAQQVLARLTAENTELTEGMVAERALVDPALADDGYQGTGDYIDGEVQEDTGETDDSES